jgi:plasmid stabilization system protein ParE
MAFRVEISPRAYRDLDSIATVIGEGSSPEAARKWFLAVLDVIEKVRVLLYGRKNRSYKISFCVQPDTQTNGIVSVFHVRHWARRNLSTYELMQMTDEFRN